MICHRVENHRDPRRSHLKLWQDTSCGKSRVDLLYVSDISIWITRKTSLVFLSACSVADAESEEFSDKNLDIANSFAVAGVSDVVGSMWKVESSVATAVASRFWRILSTFFSEEGVFTGELVARALYIAVLITGGDWREDSLTWAGFIHVDSMGSESLTKMRDNSDNKKDKSGDEKNYSDDEDLLTTTDDRSHKIDGQVSEKEIKIFNPSKSIVKR